MSSVAMKNNYKDIEYSLKKSDRRTTSIYIERDGSVSVLAPEPFNMERVEGIIEKKRRWIYRNLAEWEDLNRTRVHREYVNGESFLYLGRSYRLQLVVRQNVPLKLMHGQFLLKKSEVSSAPKHFRNCYKTKLLNKLEDRFAYYGPKLSLAPKKIKIMELKNRWGSCTPDGAINIHWKCAMLPLSVLDYVVAHELIHLKYPNHTPAFWRTVEKVMPEYEMQKKWLKFNGAGMDL